MEKQMADVLEESLRAAEAEGELNAVTYLEDIMGKLEELAELGVNEVNPLFDRLRRAMASFLLKKV